MKQAVALFIRYPRKTTLCQEQGVCQMNVYVGTAGFSYKDWEGIVYPIDLKRRKIHPLEYLRDQHQFYGHIRPSVGKDWCEKTAAVNSDFQFTAKLFQTWGE